MVWLTWMHLPRKAVRAPRPTYNPPSELHSGILLRESSPYFNKSVENISVVPTGRCLHRIIAQKNKAIRKQGKLCHWWLVLVHFLHLPLKSFIFFTLWTEISHYIRARNIRVRQDSNKNNHKSFNKVWYNISWNQYWI